MVLNKLDWIGLKICVFLQFLPTSVLSEGVIHLSKPVSVSNLKPDSVSVCTWSRQFRSSQFLWIHKINKYGSFDDGYWIIVGAKDNKYTSGINESARYLEPPHSTVPTAANSLSSSFITPEGSKISHKNTKIHKIIHRAIYFQSMALLQCSAIECWGPVITSDASHQRQLTS